MKKYDLVVLTERYELYRPGTVFFVKDTKNSLKNCLTVITKQSVYFEKEIIPTSLFREGSLEEQIAFTVLVFASNPTLAILIAMQNAILKELAAYLTESAFVNSQYMQNIVIPSVMVSVFHQEITFTEAQTFFDMFSCE